MSTLWTPGGEHPVDRPRPGASGGADPAGAEAAPAPPRRDREASEAPDVDPGVAELQRQLLQAPPEVVVANHAFGLFQLAALHLSQERPDFDAARLAIDAMGALVDGMAGRLGEAEPDLVDGLGQIRLAYVQVQAAHSRTGSGPGGPPG